MDQVETSDEMTRKLGKKWAQMFNELLITPLIDELEHTHFKEKLVCGCMGFFIGILTMLVVLAI